MPERIQLRRTAGWRKPAGAVVVARPTRWGNPFRVGDPDPLSTWLAGRPGVEVLVPTAIGSAQEAVFWFAHYAERRAASEPGWLAPLAGRDLACWCPPSSPCHADVLLSLANR